MVRGAQLQRSLDHCAVCTLGRQLHKGPTLNDGELRKQFRNWLSVYSASPKHLYANGNSEGCNAHNEGQWCCLEPEHPGFEHVLDVLVAATKGHPKTEEQR
jgi:hypothetical protein